MLQGGSEPFHGVSGGSMWHSTTFKRCQEQRVSSGFSEIRRGISRRFSGVHGFLGCIFGSFSDFSRVSGISGGSQGDSGEFQGVSYMRFQGCFMRFQGVSKWPQKRLSGSLGV